MPVSTTTGKQWAGTGRARLALAGLCAVVAAGCGGSGSPFDNASNIDNSGAGSSGQKLSLSYFQKCINPIFKKALTINLNGTLSVNTCAGSGCHDNSTGTGGAFRVIGSAPDVDTFVSTTNTEDMIRASDMYKNFFSAQGSAVISAPTQSRLVGKPLLLNVLHGGGLIFLNSDVPEVKEMLYWIGHPAPPQQDEFGAFGSGLLTSTGACQNPNP